MGNEDDIVLSHEGAIARHMASPSCPQWLLTQEVTFTPVTWLL